MNIILRRCLGMLNLTMWKRDYYDPAALTEIPVRIFFYNIHKFFLLKFGSSCSNISWTYGPATWLLSDITRMDFFLV
jgi:hypothetical protein